VALALFLLAVNGGMLTAQRSHLEEAINWNCGTGLSKSWLQAFAWIAPIRRRMHILRWILATWRPRAKTSWLRALAERSQLADASKTRLW